MTIMEDVSNFEESAEDVVASKSTSKSALRQDQIDKYVRLLKQAGTDKGAFAVAHSTIVDDTTLKAPEIIAIANAYSVGGIKATTKANAIARMKKRFVEIVRTAGNLAIAEKSRPW
jgi:hypothetical protein